MFALIKMSTSHIYIISGLGADERVFQKLDFSNYNITHIKWEIQSYKMTLAEYAALLIQQIKHHKPIIIGMSFGGIMASEIAKLIEIEKIILLASVKTKYELPFHFRLIAFLKLNKILPLNFYTKSNALTYWLFGLKTNEEKLLLNQILEDSNALFLKWAVGKIMNWQNINIPSNICHIHGTRDRIFPIKFIHCNYKIQGGGHFMTMNKPNEIMKILNKELIH